MVLSLDCQKTFSQVNKMNNPWILVRNELPPKDGEYECCNFLSPSHDSGIATYDGYGFKQEGIYKDPLYWRHYIPMQKKYGKVFND